MIRIYVRNTTECITIVINYARDYKDQSKKKVKLLNSVAGFSV